jgi:tRNA pseudouridine32 synthase / 23S rRNA pseudouridine746 synthase
MRDHAASTVHLPPGDWPTVLDALCARFVHVAREAWLQRMARGAVTDAQGVALTAQTPYREGLCIHYQREVADEVAIPFEASVLHVDADLVVVDKPHFLPVMPAGRFVEHTVLRRLVRTLGNPELVPLHRIDRLTAGLVLFSANRATRDAYQALFRERRVAKRYLACAPPLPNAAWPLLHRSRLVPGEPFFRMGEVPGTANSETRIEPLSRDGELWRYALYPLTGRKHQLRVHMAALGAPIANDPWYPHLTAVAADDWRHPLRLLAQRLAFVDPLSGEQRTFESRLPL